MLKEYNKKRNFKNTTEPKGEVKTSKKSTSTKTNKTPTGIKKQTNNKSKQKIFVVQYHQARAKHYDLRLEHKGVLLSWAVPKGLSQNPKDKRLAVMVEDHPIDYATFEGVIPKGNYGAGTVEIFDSGQYEQLKSFDAGLKKGQLKFALNGEKLKGAWSLVKIDSKNWLVIKENDQFAVAKKQNTKKIKNPFDKCEVELATLSKTIPKGNNWLFEIKYDGYRIVSFVQNGKVKLVSRNNKDYTKKFANIVESLKKIEQDAFIVDGEIVVFDQNGKSDFGLLQQNIKQQNSDFYYVIFDILALNGKDLRKQTLNERKKVLERIVAKASNNLVFSNYIVGKGTQSFNFAKKHNLEGIIAKKTDSEYIGKRTDDWLKIKCYLRQEFVIAGYTKTNKNKYVSAILVGYYDKNNLIYVGKVGTGFTEEQKIEISKKFKSLERKTCPFAEISNNKNAIWLKPELVAEIQFAEITKSGVLRQPSFIGLRKDKDPKNVVLEKAKN